MLHTGKPVEVMLAAIQALDLEPVKTRVMDPKVGEGWSREYADSIERAYKTYLSMLAKNPEEAEDILLSKDVDEFWHTHILQTIKYHEDCEAVFGKYLHHQPHIGELTAADIAKREALAEKTRQLYQAEFGDEENSNFAWSGIPLKAEDAAISGAAIRSGNSAISGAAIRSEHAAISGAAVRALNAARFEAAIGQGAVIRAGNAAISGAAIRSENAAISGAAIRPENAAISGAAIRPEAARETEAHA